MFDLKKFKTGEYFVHLPTQETYDKVMKFLDENGFVWADGNLLQQSYNWDKHANLTSIVFSNDDTIQFGSTTSCLLVGYKKLEINKDKDV